MDGGPVDPGQERKVRPSAKVSVAHPRRGGDAVTNATGVAGARSSCRADRDAQFVKVAKCWTPCRCFTLAI